MPRRVIDPSRPISQAYAIAPRDGISALSMRKVVTACGVAIGSAYDYFPTRADLTVAVLTRFFEESLPDELCTARPGEHFTSYVRRFREALRVVYADMSANWSAEMCRLPSDEQEALEAVCAPMLARMERGLVCVLDANEAVDRSWLVGPVSTEALCHYMLRAVLTSLMGGDECETSFVLLNTPPCDDTTEEKDTRE